MGIIDQIKKDLKMCYKVLPDIVNYQIVTKVFIAVWLFLFDRIFQALLISSGRVAVTSGDYMFLFTTWQGILILVLGLISLFLYVAFDLNAQIVLCRELLNGRKARLGVCFKEGLSSIKKLLNLRGILVVLYITFISPILGFGVSIAMTRGLYIPTFIAAFIESSVLYSVLGIIAVLIFLSIGIANLFILHGIIIDKIPIKESGKQSSDLIRANWKDYLKQNILYILIIAVTVVAVAVVCLFIPLKLIDILPLPTLIGRPLIILFAIVGVIVSTLTDLVGIPVYLLKMTQLFYSYKQGEEFEAAEISERKKTRHKVGSLVTLTTVILAVILITVFFDRLFPVKSNVDVIAHRGGGNEGPENTVAGLEIARKAGAYGSEIDIQRTKDGHYIINHDGTFKRVTGVSGKPEEMTLNEVKKLSIDGEPVATIEEMLAASKGSMVLFIELKGNTADRKMADDTVRLVKEYQMEEECVLISLKYDIIDYIESTYPEIQTGFLTFASFGETAALNCDYLGLEEESATADTVSAIHNENKKVLVWTVNEEGSQKYFLCSRVDGIITDNVSQALKLFGELEDRSDLERMIDKIKTLL